MIAERARLAKNVNHLYWESSESVNRIADRLDLSKGALYDLIEPAPAGGACPDCDAPLSFTNRTARDRGVAECVACPLQSPAAEDAALPVPRPGMAPAPADPGSRRWSGRALAGLSAPGAGRRSADRAHRAPPVRARPCGIR